MTKKNVLISVSSKNIALIHSWNKHLVSAYYVPDIVLVLGKSLNLWSLNSSHRRQKIRLVSKIHNLFGRVKCYEKNNKTGNGGWEGMEVGTVGCS